MHLVPLGKCIANCHILYFLMGKPVYIKKLINSLYIKNCDIKIWNSFDDLQKKIRKQFPNEN